MRLKLYCAPTVAAAMALVRAELGDEALILATRRTPTGIELTAALEPAPTPSTPPFTPPRTAQNAPTGTPSGPPPATPDPSRLAALRFHGVPAAMAAALGIGPLQATLPRTIRFAALDFAPGAPPLLLAGPPGAGKTLTTVRLATRLVMQGLTPLVVSTDADRAGATEQLAAFTRLLGLTLVAAPDPVALARALARRHHGAPVLIDTAGIDPFAAADQARISGLATIAAGRTALVLPAGLDVQEAADTAAVFAAAGATLLIATKLDVARRLGGIVAAGALLPLAEAGIGPGAADGMLPFTPALLAARLAPPIARKAA